MRMLEDYLITEIDLKSYSSSKGYSGHFACEGNFSKSKVGDAIDFFENYWESTGNENLTLATNLLVANSLESLVKDYEYDTDDIGKYILPLLDNGFIEIKKPGRQDTAAANNDNKEIFRIYQISQDDSENLYKLFFVVMALGGTYGHVFIQYENEGLITYPHDDVGFGLISQIADNIHVKTFFDLAEKSNFAIRTM